MQSKTTHTRNYRHRHPEKAKAHTAIRQRIKSGKLVALPCEKCGSTPTHAHHEDYSKPLEIVWLCQPCHVERHRELAAIDPEKWGHYTRHERPAKLPRAPRKRYPSKRPKKPRSYPKHTLATQAQILRQQGNTYAEIATSLGVSRATVFKWVNQPAYN